MIFTSYDFVVFFLVVLGAYWSLPHRAQNWFLLAASYFFYGYVHPWFAVVMIASTSVDYLSALAIERWPRHKRFALIVSVVSNLGLLGFLKYRNFFLESFGASSTLSILLPVGISFYTFQALSYVIDVYRGDLKAQRNYVDYALYLAFFPQLVAGPIERATVMLPQIERRRFFKIDQAQQGLFLIVWGYFKKLTIADNVAIIANKIFALSDVSFSLLWVGVFAFAIQIYADFSAYTDIARGCAKWLGFELSLNFRHPYTATSPADFWKRWHISLSQWIRDYLYIPLGGSRRGPVRNAVNVMVTFGLFGLWHGASWNFVLWGMYHGALVLVSRAISIPRWIPGPARAAGMFVLVAVGWLFFRETDLSYLYRHLTLSPLADAPDQTRAASYLFALVGLYSLPLWLHAAYEKLETRPSFDLAFKTVASSILFFGLMTLSAQHTSDFIYFRF